ncbi:uncharacterized protein PV07_00853 [Cladophialophora immunda]|uniref:Uncharacterized protein n=1 Tax=Cladophialophora immunda TaxID=569365 RepID=A0A0D2A0Y8_9EURO|nr:uncharacterized protein PV07_00853 [Cladophialophora immunda]KIW34051.1 hypothetical protein PV07_00853 [Cladophialophora immunda]
MATTAAAAATLPIPLELRLRLSRLHVRFKIRGSDEAVSARADSVYHFEELTIFVDRFLRATQPAVHKNGLPAPGAWELWSDGVPLDLACWTSDITRSSLVEIAASTSSRKTSMDLLTIHRPTMPPVYIDVPQPAIIGLPKRPYSFVDLHLFKRAGNGKKPKVHLLRKIQVVAERSLTLTDLLRHVETSPPPIYSALIRDRTDGLTGTEITPGQYDNAISSIMDKLDLDVEIVLK